MPPFEHYNKIYMEKLPVGISPEELWSIGSVIILPVTYNDLFRLYNEIEINNDINYLRVEYKYLPDKMHDLHPLNRRIDIFANQIIKHNKEKNDIENIKYWIKEAVVNFLNHFLKGEKKCNNSNEVKILRDVYYKIFKDDGPVLYNDFPDYINKGKSFK